MYIKQIVLEGFKSYGKRVEVNDFDPQFTAITGLNGSGKSNILDAICFVLGISNLTHVRAGNLQELIYKSGQAGINKATVSIKFDNTDNEQSPLGYEKFEEITISRQVFMGGKNKYWINGLVVQSKKIQDLFCSVQLNVNNPHFLIMQGRVTKVLNMKPHEILAMVEESAGTRMYETKRQSVLKTIEKKDGKLKELNDIFNEEISPKLNKLREERNSYLEYLRNEREIEHMSGLYQAWLYYATERCTKQAEENLKLSEEKIVDMKNNIEQNLETVKQIEKEISRLAEEADKMASGNITELESNVKSRHKTEAHASAEEKSLKENINIEQKKLLSLEKSRKDDENHLKTKENELSKVQSLFETLKQNDEKDKAAFALSQKKYEAVCTGMEINEDGEAETLQEQLMSAKQEAAKASAEMQTANIQLMHNQSLLKEKEKELGSNLTEYNRNQKIVQEVGAQVKSLENDLSKLNFSEDHMLELQERRRKLIYEVRSLREKIDGFEARRPFTKFNYKDPEPNFNRKNVHGIVCKLFGVKNNIHCTALETAAGGKLYNVVVETDRVSKQLLQNGQLQTRTTFIPLNKIQAHRLDQRKVKLAQDLVGAENVQPALSLINFDRKLESAMEFVFGNVFICKDMTVARQITFNDQIRTKCVTLDGDVTDPGGTLSGGARHKGTPVLLQINDIAESETAFQTKDNEIARIDAEIDALSRSEEKYEQLKKQYEMKSCEYQMAKQQLEQTTHHQQQQEVQKLKEKIDHLMKRQKECKEIEKTCSKKATELESIVKDSSSYKEKMLKNAESEMKQRKAQSEKSKTEWQKREHEYKALTLEISELKTDIEKGENAIEATKRIIEELQETLEAKEGSLKNSREELLEAENKLKEEKARVTAKNKECQEKNKRKDKLLAQNAELDLEIKKQIHESNKLKSDYRNAQEKEREIAKKFKKDNRDLEAAKNLTDKQAHDLQNRIAKAQDKKKQLGRTVNAKAQSMFEHEEKQYNTLLKKKGIVESDKQKLLAVIKDMDRKKKDALQLAYNQVKKDFGSIFGTLLPGSDATLKPPDGKTILEGLEVKVSLGGVWKESLSELSGGQRSLVALSLILAMLLFKPAPLYILDEVDAALDLSHTQNIGNMLKNHFKQSQFIIVSLKDGMFNNANVLFRTKFIDGMSTVSRTVHKTS